MKKYNVTYKTTMHGKNVVLRGVFVAKNELDLYKSFIRRYKESGYIIKAVEIKT